MRNTYPTLDGWRERVRRASLAQPGSLLAADGKAWPPNPLADCAAACLTAAVDHLQAVRVLSDESKSLHPLATYSLTRGALLSAATSVWLLAPPEPEERQKRGRAYADHLLMRRQEWNAEIRTAPGVNWRRLATVQRALVLRRHGVRVYAGSHRGLSMPSPTALVGKAASTVFATEPAVATEIRAQWRATSSDAHGLVWGH
ncbi:hypothetical protein GCM10022415_33530 [Knoellia locipacati]|uniref:Uncharacterized protein n=1 Tax=Knoellia locipacati TaxID=882824 RepID=A0A512T4U4_9MICO|nr:hypothetical protein KLO01_32810 [Knoellia locipacati]